MKHWQRTAARYHRQILASACKSSQVDVLYLLRTNYDVLHSIAQCLHRPLFTTSQFHASTMLLAILMDQTSAWTSAGNPYGILSLGLTPSCARSMLRQASTSREHTSLLHRRCRSTRGWKCVLKKLLTCSRYFSGDRFLTPSKCRRGLTALCKVCLTAGAITPTAFTTSCAAIYTYE